MILVLKQRKFVRESTDVPSSNFYYGFRKWLDEHYSVINQTVWDQIIAEDSEIDYHNIGNGMLLCPNEVEETVEIPNEDTSHLNNSNID